MMGSEAKGWAVLTEAISAHLVQGRMDAPAIARLEFIVSELPRGSEYVGGRLYRGVMLGQTDCNTLAAGFPIARDDVAYECWTRSELAAITMLRTRAEQYPDHVAVLLSRDVEPDEVAFDLPELMAQLEIDRPDFPGWKYAQREAEVILRNRDAVSAILPTDVARQFTGEWHHGLFEPMPGESFHDWDTGGELTIDSTVGQANGCLLAVAAGQVYPLIWQIDCWDLGGQPLGALEDFLSKSSEPSPW